MRSCFNSTIEAFINTRENDWLIKMLSNFKSIFNGETPSSEQVIAWKDCFMKLKEELKKVNLEGYIIFEYILPMEGGRRPDVILLLEKKVIILEFKMKRKYLQADLDQLKGYYRDIVGYHKESETLEVIPFLVVTLTENMYEKVDGKYNTCSSNMLLKILEPMLGMKNLSISPQKWMNSEYFPLPTLINSAIDIFKNNNIKELKMAKSAGIYVALKKLKRISSWTTNQDQNKYNSISFVTGVPGAGKTLLGLEFVHNSRDGMFLSGNGPLVKVLQYALKSNTFVTDLYKFKSEYSNNNKQPHTNIIVFDEAQRAWDEEKNFKYKKSEPRCIIEIADKTIKNCHYLALIGEGQKIYTGEEKGIELWMEALKKSKNLWYVTCPESLKNYFEGIDNVKVSSIREFNLDSSLRTHIATKYPEWVRDILDNKINKNLAQEIQKNEFNMYITRNLDKAKEYCRTRYKGVLNKKYGLLVSSKTRIFLKDIKAKKINDKNKLGPWFHDDINSIKSCCSFNEVATEFDCQGLEIDMPIVCWGEDLIYTGSEWKKYTQDKKLKDPHRIRINSYRVLLTRGRDGVIIYIPKDKKLDETSEFLLKAGMKKLNS